MLIGAAGPERRGDPRQKRHGMRPRAMNRENRASSPVMRHLLGRRFRPAGGGSRSPRQGGEAAHGQATAGEGGLETVRGRLACVGGRSVGGGKVPVQAVAWPASTRAAAALAAAAAPRLPALACACPATAPCGEVSPRKGESGREVFALL